MLIRLRQGFRQVACARPRHDARLMIVAATTAHATALAAIHAEAFQPREAWGADAIALQLALSGAIGLIDERGGMLLGRIVSDAAEVLTLAVAPSARRQGVATALIEAVKRMVSQRGCRSLFLEVATGNIAALALYRRAGFAEVGRRRRYYSDGSDALVMRVNLL
jgi:ribosomal-protein-alanine N-acetyltransferase